ncbi:ATP-binding protein [Evansella sp. AB-rgal1]|uniref:ATP-binding protein n=1 Tax=Evansella sp. AB-rgal1 TaxID=3242696 RepID=UPI00359E97BD
MYGLEALLLNVLFLIVFMIFIPLSLEFNQKIFKCEKNKSRLSVFSIVLGILCCMSFPISIIEGYIFDLRLVAIMIGGLYYGFPTSLMLSGIMIIYRFFLGGIGVSATLVVTFILLVSIFFLTKSFRYGSRRKKLIIGNSLAFITTILVLVNSTFLFNISIPSSLIILYVSISMVATFMIIYIYEVFRESIFINQRIIKAEKMEIVSHLASSISHEVRNPLAVIRGFLQMLDQSEVSKEKRQQYLRISIQEIDRANDIIRNYLTFAKPSMVNIKMIDVKEELLRAVNIITPLANMNSIEIKTDIHSSFIVGETQLLQQCLLNITKNCIEAMPNSGLLTIETQENNKELIIHVGDTGTGMSPEQLSRIGEPYFTTKGREGTGLGMMAAMQIIEILGGKLQVTSEVNEGTDFYITLPLEEKHQHSDTQQIHIS